MRTRIGRLAWTLLALSLFQTGIGSTIDIDAERKALMEADRNWAKAAHENDFETIWKYWSDGGIMLMSAEARLTGIEQYKTFTQNVRKDPSFSINWTVEGADVSASGDMGYTYGIGEITRTGANGEIQTMRSPYLIVWKKNDTGLWQSVIEK